MTARDRLAIAAIGLLFAAALLFVDRTLSGVLQCSAEVAPSGCPGSARP